MIRAVVFDLDGVLIDSEQLWDEVRREVAAEYGRPWADGATAAMQGMSSPEWSRYMVDEVGVPLAADQVAERVVNGMLAHYSDGPPLIPGAVDAVRRIAERWPLALASSSNRVVIDTVLEVAGLSGLFVATVSSEEVAHGKPAPDVYLEAVRRLGQSAPSCAAVEDAANGIRSAVAAGMRVVAIPNEHYPPPGAVLASAAVVLDGIRELTVEVIERLGDERRLDEQEDESFPASDSHSDWAGPPN